MNLDQVNAIEKRYQGVPLGFKFRETSDGENALSLMRELQQKDQATFLHFSSCDTSRPVPILVDYSIWKNPVFQMRISPHIERITSVRTSVLRVVQYGTEEERQEFTRSVVANSLGREIPPRFRVCEFILDTGLCVEHGFYSVVIIATDKRNTPDKVAFKLILDGWSAYSFDSEYGQCIATIDTYSDIKNVLITLIARHAQRYKKAK